MTNEIFYQDPYAKSCKAIVAAIELKGQNAVAEFTSTVCYPIGGGQPSDEATITGPSGMLNVKQVQRRGYSILHQGKLLGELRVGDEVEIAIKWSHRHHCMRLHTAGHLLHDALQEIADFPLVPVKGHHGKKAYLEYAGTGPIKIERLQGQIDGLISRNLPVRMSEATLDAIKEACAFVPPGLPSNKPLRIVQIGDHSPVPCGGVHVKSLDEIGQLIVQAAVEDSPGAWKLKYRISAAQ